MQNKYESFSVCLDRLIRQRNLTPAQLSRLLEHKSRTTLQRVFNGSAGIDSLQKICAEVCGCPALDLTAEEKDALHTAVSVDQVGAATLRARDEIRSLLRPSNSETARIVVHQGPKECTLSEITEEMKQADSSDVLILNCAWRAFADELNHLLSTVSADRLNIQHYMAITNDLPRTVSIIGILRDLFGFVNYRCFSIIDNSNPTDPLTFMGMNGAAIRIRHGDSVKEYQLIFTGEFNGVMLEAPGTYTYWENYLKALNCTVSSIKTTYPAISSAEDYISFTDVYRKTEENRNIYVYKPDLGFPLIPTHIIRQACLDNAAEIGADIPDFMEMLEKLAEIQNKRFHNIFNQKKAVHTVFFPSAIRKFAYTGFQTDHFYLLRPFTVEERIEILTHLVYQMRTNPYFHVYLLRDEQNFVEMEAICYEGCGVQFTSAYTDYNLSSGHTEAIITHEEFCNLFLNFFRNDLLVNHVYSSAAAVFLFESLIEELKNTVTP